MTPTPLTTDDIQDRLKDAEQTLEEQTRATNQASQELRVYRNRLRAIQAKQDALDDLEDSFSKQEYDEHHRAIEKERKEAQKGLEAARQAALEAEDAANKAIGLCEFYRHMLDGGKWTGSCPYCDAAPGEPCVTNSGDERSKPHAARGED